MFKVKLLLVWLHNLSRWYLWKRAFFQVHTKNRHLSLIFRPLKIHICCIVAALEISCHLRNQGTDLSVNCVYKVYQNKHSYK